MENLLDNIKLFVFDVDGTLLLGPNPLPFAKEVIILLQSKNIDFLIISNNSSYSADENKKRLENILDVNLENSNIYTSIQATIDYLLKSNIVNCYLIGTPSMVTEFEQSGIFNTETNPQAIVLGFDKTLNYEKIKTTSLLLQKKEKIPFFATHPDDTCPVDEGRIPDVGSFLKLFENATGRTADLILGKPSKLILELVLTKRNIDVSEVLVIGDRIETDIRMASESNVNSALVLTGEFSEDKKNTTQFTPTFIWKNLEQLFEYLKVK